MRRHFTRLLIAALFALGLVGLRPHPSFAASTVSDCPSTEAALRSDLTSAGDGGTVAFTCAAATTIPLDSADGGTGPITISQGVSLDASGATGTVTFDGKNASQLFVVSAGALTLRHLTLAHGNSFCSTYYCLAGGGAIQNNGGTVSIADSTLSGGSASCTGISCRAWGGAIYNNGGTVTIASSTFSGNSCILRISCAGGVILNYGTTTISTSTFSGNSCTSTTFGECDGGAIFNVGGVTISNSTFSGNSATFGGAILNVGGATISNSSFSGNSAHSIGGAIASYATTTISTSTFSGNSAVYYGGAIADRAGTVSVSGSIVANSPSGGNCYSSSTVIDAGYNLSDTNCGFSAANHDLINTDPQLGPLEDNGGPTQTLLPADGSPAIDAGLSGADCSGSDQRGVPRPQGAACDIGAVEATAPSVTVSFPTPPTGQNGYFNASQVPVIGSVKATDSFPLQSLSCTGADLSYTSGLGTTSAGGTLTVSAEGKTNVRCTAQDTLHGSGAGSADVQIDTAPPSGVTATPDRQPNANGWYTSSVTVSAPTASDAGSGLASCTTPTYTGPDSATASLTVTCTDNAGNSTSDTATFKYDATGPAISDQGDACSLTVVNGWCRGTESSTFAFTDATSGMASPCSAGAATTCTQQVSSQGDGAAVTLSSGQAGDFAGNTSPAISSGPFQLDATAPTVTCTTPAPTVLLHLAGAQVSASVYDLTSGPQGGAPGTTTTISAGADTSVVGSVSASLTGSDNAGNTTKVSCPYQVGYKGQQTAVANAAGKLAVSVQLQDATGQNVSSASIPVTALRILNSSNVTVKTLNAPFTYTTTGPAGFVGGVYGYATSTGLPAGTYTLVYQAGTDPTTHSVSFSF